MSPAFRSTSGDNRTTGGVVTSKLGTQLKVRFGPSVIAATVVAPLTSGQVAVGDTVLVRWQQDKAYAYAKLEQAAPAAGATVVLNAASASAADDDAPQVVYPPAPPFDDNHLVWRDGTRWLYARARWAWELGAEVASTLRSITDGLQVFGHLYAGVRYGLHVGWIGWRRNDANTADAVTFEATDHRNVPFFGLGGFLQGPVWAHFGYWDRAHIRLNPETRDVEIDAAAIVGSMPPAATPICMDFGERYP